MKARLIVVGALTYVVITFSLAILWYLLLFKKPYEWVILV
ncbi:MAG: hypothetical protein M2R45_04368 [Verrucomicrobia subdivision 3 bacterium]|nr:hypothetical protein [Limisphaerales bacterium]MCS1416073.1 hypothetical protein [Limisphaerales bacterium]